MKRFPRKDSEDRAADRLAETYRNPKPYLVILADGIKAAQGRQ